MKNWTTSNPYDYEPYGYRRAAKKFTNNDECKHIIKLKNSLVVDQFLQFEIVKEEL